MELLYVLYAVIAVLVILACYLYYKISEETQQMTECKAATVNEQIRLSSAQNSLENANSQIFALTNQIANVNASNINIDSRIALETNQQGKCVATKASSQATVDTMQTNLNKLNSQLENVQSQLNSTADQLVAFQKQDDLWNAIQVYATFTNGTLTPLINQLQNAQKDLQNAQKDLQNIQQQLLKWIANGSSQNQINQGNQLVSNYGQQISALQSLIQNLQNQITTAQQQQADFLSTVVNKGAVVGISKADLYNQGYLSQCQSLSQSVVCNA